MSMIEARITIQLPIYKNDRGHYIKMKKFSLIILFFIPFFLTSCETTESYKVKREYITEVDEFYTELSDPNKIPEECKLQPNTEPKVYSSNNIDSDVYTLLSQYYFIIGYAGCNGTTDSVNKLKQTATTLCKKHKAQIALYSFEYTDSRNGWTQYGSYSIKRYDCNIVLLSPYEESYKNRVRFGFDFRDLTNSERKEIQRNTGAYIDVVFDKSPAFYANLIPGDIVIQVNEIEITDNSLLYFMSLLLQEDSVVTIKYLRNGQEYEKTYTVH